MTTPTRCGHCGVEEADTRVEAIRSKLYPGGIAICAGYAPGLWFFPARTYTEHCTGAFDTSAWHTRRCSLQAHRRARRGRYHSEESARISVIAIVTTANHGGTLVAPKTPDLAARCMATVYGSVDELAIIMLRSQAICLPMHLELTGPHALMAARSGLRRFCHRALMPSCPLPLAFNDPSSYDASYDRTKRVHVS
jgi:hypothetical protein